MINFLSAFSFQLNLFIDSKKALGYSYNSEILLLKSFDLFCTHLTPNPKSLTKELIEKWIEPRTASERPGTTNHRISVMREFGQFLKLIGEPAYIIPQKFRVKNSQYVCRIMSENEVINIFMAADSYEHKSRIFLGTTLSVILRVLYSTGLRPGEIVNLKLDDVDLSTGEIRIIESKGHKNRTIYIEDEVVKLLLKYCKFLSLYKDRQYFFYDGNGDTSKGLSLDVIRDAFHGICKKIGLREPLPRLYDFRHTFITHRILLWNKQGINLKVYLPYLSAYVGHNSLQDTYYYFKLDPNYFDYLSKPFIEKLSRLLPSGED